LTIKIKEKEVYKDWGLDDVNFEPSETKERKTETKQLIIDLLGIVNRFRKKVWEYSIFSVKEYLKRREDSDKHNF
jgi:hypothetical protein